MAAGSKPPKESPHREAKQLARKRKPKRKKRTRDKGKLLAREEVKLFKLT